MDAIETARRYYACFNAKDYGGMLALVHADIVHDVNQGPTRLGKSLFEAFLLEMDAAYEEQLTDMTFFSEPKGERVAVQFTVNGTYKQGDEPPARGQSYVLPAGAFLSVRDGLVTRVTTYYNLPLWIQLVSE